MSIQLPENGQYVETTYDPKTGARKSTAHGFPGNLCRKAMDPYAVRQGQVEGHETDEAQQSDNQEHVLEAQAQQHPA